MPGYRSPIASGLACRCPRCGRGKLLVGLLKPADRCSNCDLDFHPAESGDGPIAFIILILGALILPFVFLVEFKLNPPFWVHLLLWPPIIVGGTLLLMRPAKGLLIALHLHHRAGEGRS
ncbi:MAG: DUF983 domain-containing protein [Dongia sp.]|jgi:uncharacterized protein (DUF983 family)